MLSVKVTHDGTIEVKSHKFSARFNRDAYTDMLRTLEFALASEPTEPEPAEVPVKTGAPKKLGSLPAAVLKELSKPRTVDYLCGVKAVRSHVSSDDEGRIRASVAATVTRLITKGLVSNKGDEYTAVKE